jgi:SAM-dependent MidA family methyltransferase
VDIEPAFRLDPPVDVASVASEPALVERISQEIARTGPMTFARFMTIALYDPDHGYYSGPIARPTRGGDFLTAPELHPVFGRLVGRQLDEVWQRLDRPVPFTIREHGAGAGTLGLAIMEGLRADGSALAEAIRYQPIEPNRHRLADLRERWATAGVVDRIGRPEGQVVGAVIANELLDALPVHRVRMVDGELHELLVTRSEAGFVELAGPLSTPDLAAHLRADGVDLSDGQVAEICLAVGPWVSAAAASLDRGMLLIVDYGHPADVLYGPDRRDGTLRAYIGHQVHGDPFRHVGRQDLTAHVDLTAVERAAREAGLEVLGRTTQAEFLVGLGLGELLDAAGSVGIEAGPGAIATYLGVRAAVARLLDPRALGGFAVLGFGRDLPPVPPLAGFAWRLPREGPT